MIVFEKSGGKGYTVYDITYDKAGYPHFLIYKDGQWIRQSAKYFTPEYHVGGTAKEVSHEKNLGYRRRWFLGK